MTTPINPVDFVRYYNAWRVGGDMDQPDPSTITRMLAELCDHAERLDRELETAREQVSSRNKRLADMARELEQERQDRKQADIDTIRALGERNEARVELAKVRDQLADYIQADLDDSIMRSAATWRPLPGDPEQLYPQNQPETDDDQARDPA